MPSTNVDVGADPAWPLEKWLKFINEQIEAHGPKAILYTDAGYNNVSLIVEVTEEKKDDSRKRNSRRPL